MGSLFTLTVKEFENITFTEQTATGVQLVVWGLAIGFFLAALFSLYQRFVVGAPIRALLRLLALSPESAKTEEELGIGGNVLLHRALTKNTSVQKLIKKTEGEPCGYYIPEELKYRAELRYEKKGNPFLQIVLAALLSVVIGVAFIKLIPLFLSMIDAIL